MNKIKIVVVNGTGSGRRTGELCLLSGIIKYDSGNEYSHISALSGKTIFEVPEIVEVIAPVTEKARKVSPVRSGKKKSAK